MHIFRIDREGAMINLRQYEFKYAPHFGSFLGKDSPILQVSSRGYLGMDALKRIIGNCEVFSTGGGT